MIIVKKIGNSYISVASSKTRNNSGPYKRGPPKDTLSAKRFRIQGETWYMRAGRNAC
jgi:hypothetical protein